MSLSENDRYSASGQLSYERLPPIRKLFSQSTEDCEDDIESDNETFQVYLRIKPNPDYKNTIKIVNGSKLICKPPITSKMYKTAEKSEFTFSKIFGPETTQKTVFEDTVLPSVVDLIRARNSLIFSYGTTNAGKTYTIQGDNRNPGLIPRALHVLFSRINTDENVRYAPHMATSVKRLSVEESAGKCLQKEDLLKLYASTRMNKVSHYPELSDDFAEMSRSFNDYSNDPYSSNLPTCSVWVSFLELYNELIYDLLDPCVGPSRKQLKLSTDKHQNYYVKGLKEFCVQNAEEAYSIYLFGKKNLNVACTKMNESSSRSHCIFVMKLINQSDPEFVTISSLSICDLAGTERQTKTQNTGVRLKEAGNINLSLFTLNRCLKTLRENQSGTLASQVIPYRSSKLTQLLSSALLDKNDEKIIMIVNINPSQELYDETQQVLKICAIACEIRNKPMKNARIMQRARFSSIAFERPNDGFTYQPFELEMSNYQENNELIEDYLDRIQQLEEELKDRNDTIEEINKHYQQMLKDSSKFHDDEVELMKKEFNESMQRRLKSLKEYYEWKIQELTRDDPKHDNNDEIHKKLEEMTLQNEELHKQNEELQKLANDNRHNIELVEMKRELSKMSEMLKEKDRSIETLNEELSTLLEQNKVLSLNVNYLESCERELQNELENKEKELEDKANHIQYLEKIVGDKENKKSKKRLDKKKKLFNPDDEDIYSLESSPQVEVLKETRSRNEMATPAEAIKSYRKKKFN